MDEALAASKKNSIPSASVPGRNRKPDPEALSRYVEAHPEAMIRDIAEAFGVSEDYMRQSLKKNGIPYAPGPDRNRRKLDPELLREYVETHPEASTRDLAKALGMSRSCIRQSLKKNGIPHARVRASNPEDIRRYVEAHPKTVRGRGTP